MKIITFVNGLLVAKEPEGWEFIVEAEYRGGLEASLQVPIAAGPVEDAVQIQVFSEDGLFKGMFVKVGEPEEDEVGWDTRKRIVLTYRMEWL